MNYRLPLPIYKRVIWTIKDYPRRKLQYEEIIEASPAPPDGQPRGSATSDPTLSKATRAADISFEIKAIESALEKIPIEYQDGIMNYIIYKMPFPVDANEMTYKRWKKRFVYWTAVKLGIIEVET
jgi:hypothetical protein